MWFFSFVNFFLCALLIGWLNAKFVEVIYLIKMCIPCRRFLRTSGKRWADCTRGGGGKGGSGREMLRHNLCRERDGNRE